MPTLPKLIYRLNVIPITITVRFFVGIDNIILKYTLKYKGTRVDKTILKKKNEEGKLVYQSSRFTI